MSVLRLLQLGLTAGLVAYLRPHLALVLSFLWPKGLQHRFVYLPLPETDELQELFDEGYHYVGCREERWPLLMRNRYLVFAKPGGCFVDLHLADTRRLYLVSATPSGRFLLTRNYGHRGQQREQYRSVRCKGDLLDVERQHEKAALQLFNLEKPIADSSARFRMRLARRWYAQFARKELFPFALLSSLLVLLFGAMIYRVWVY